MSGKRKYFSWFFEPLLFIKHFTPHTSPLAKRLCRDPSLSLRATEGSAAIPTVKESIWLDSVLREFSRKLTHYVEAVKDME
jgi:hypothetical protein